VVAEPLVEASVPRGEGFDADGPELETAALALSASFLILDLGGVVSQVDRMIRRL